MGAKIIVCVCVNFLVFVISLRFDINHALDPIPAFSSIAGKSMSQLQSGPAAFFFFIFYSIFLF